MDGALSMAIYEQKKEGQAAVTEAVRASGESVLSGVGSRLAQAVTHYRWMICALLFVAATINYIDRQVIGLLKQTLQGQIGWNEIDYSNIIFAFQLAYAAGLLFAGRFMDWLGTRKGFSFSVLFWSVAAMAPS